MRPMRQSLRRAWRAMSWPPMSGHIVYALATGVVCGIAAAPYPAVISPPYAATLGTLFVYPATVAIWRYLHRPGSGR